MKVMMLNPPFLPRYSKTQRSPAVTKSGTLYYPHWLAYATGVLEEEGGDVKLIDAPAWEWELQDVLAEAKRFRPRLIIIDTSTPSIFSDVRVGEGLKTALPETFVTLVGTHVSALPEEVLQLSDQIDAVARGEYDYTIRDLAFTLASGGDLAKVEGISFRIDGQIVHNPPRPLIKDLDAIPMVSRAYKRHLRVEDYFYASLRHPMLTTISARGCPFHCTFCVYPQTFTMHKFRTRSVENVVDELEYIARELPQVREVFFEDDVLTVDKRRIGQIADEILRRRLKIIWSGNARADVDLETLQKIRAAGCRFLCVGFESGDQEILDHMKKRMKVERMRQFMEDSRKAGVLVHGCFMAGNPGETEETLKKTLDLALKLNPYTAQFFPIMVYPGTEAYEWFKERGYLKTQDYSQWLTEEGLHNCVVSTPELSAEKLVRFCDEARRRFYLRPKYVFSLIRQTLRHPGEISHVWMGFRSSVRILLAGTFGGVGKGGILGRILRGCGSETRSPQR